MKLFLIGFAVIAAVAADVSHLSSEYLPPALEEVQTVVEPSNEYLAPVASAPVAPVEVQQGSLADDGYRYKTHRRVVLRRHRRDVSHLPSNEYLPPQQVAAAPSNEYLPPQQVAAPVQYAPLPVAALPEPVQTIEEPVPAHELADDGYRYKTHRRVVLRRHRRDVNELSNEYLPPVAPSNEYLAPLPVESTIEQGSLADDGYRYKTNKRVVIRRHRRDVNELSNEYLPPVAPSNEYLAPLPVESTIEQGSLADDGYRYKTNKRVVIRRHRRDVNELSNEYLPPDAPSNEYLAPLPVESTIEQGSLGDDGYRYKTNKRVVIRRHRRDVSHLPSNEYLPPQQVAAAPSNEYLPPQQVAAPVQVAAPAPVYVSAPAPAPAPIQVAAPIVEAEPAHELADDGYRYKTHRRVVLRRHRRDVSHLPSNEYLPPQQVAAAPSNEYLPPQQVAAPIQVAAPAPVYVSAPAPAPAPIQVAAPAPIQVAAPAPIQVAAPVVEAEPAHELAADGYRYKTHRRVVYRRH